MTINFSKFNSLFSVMNYFNTEDKCREAIAQSRWSDGDVVCPYCGQHHCHLRKDKRYCCSNCNCNFSVKVGTIFENTKITLRKWFVAMYLISTLKADISSLQLAKDIAVTQKTAWFMLHKIRTLYKQDDSVALSGDVECDEAYIGGKEKYKHESKKTEKNQGRSLKTRSAVFGMVERKGKVVALHTPDVTGETLTTIIGQFVKEGANVHTDELGAYNALDADKYIHFVIRHKEKEYVRDNVYTNTIEGFWTSVKRMIMGIYHSISKKYLQRYINEAAWRYNTRELVGSDIFSEMFNRCLNVVSYKAVKAA